MILTNQHREEASVGRLRIHCGKCGNSWEVYHRDNWKDWRARTCPVCGESVDAQSWEGVLRGFHELEDANLELIKDHSQAQMTMFAVDYVADREKESPDDLREEFEELRENLERMEKEINTLFYGVEG